MIGLILVTHGKLASEFLVALEHVVGPQKNVATICIGPHDDMEARRNEIAAAITWDAGEAAPAKAPNRNQVINGAASPGQQVIIGSWVKSTWSPLSTIS